MGVVSICVGMDGGGCEGGPGLRGGGSSHKPLRVITGGDG